MNAVGVPFKWIFQAPTEIEELSLRTPRPVAIYLCESEAAATWFYLCESEAAATWFYLCESEAAATTHD